MNVVLYKNLIHFRIQGVMFCVFQDRMNIRKEIMELEGSERDLDYRIHVKEQYLNRIGVVFTDPIITEKVYGWKFTHSQVVLGSFELLNIAIVYIIGSHIDIDIFQM